MPITINNNLAARNENADQTEFLDPLKDNELKETIMNCGNMKAPGYDSISNVVLKYLIKKEEYF